MNHLRTSSARCAGSLPAAGATKTDGLSAQKEGSSTADFVSRTKGGAVMLERSPPRMVEIDFQPTRNVSAWLEGKDYPCRWYCRSQQCKREEYDGWDGRTPTKSFSIERLLARLVSDMMVTVDDVWDVTMIMLLGSVLTHVRKDKVYIQSECESLQAENQ
jgi:hypothetical protein